MMTDEEKRLIIAKGISGLFDVIDTIGFSEHQINAYTGNSATTADILALRNFLADLNDNAVADRAKSEIEMLRSLHHKQFGGTADETNPTSPIVAGLGWFV